MATFSTPLMNLELPVSGPGGEPGPNWADDLNTAFETIDSHDHTSGKGKRVPTAGININADLSFGGYNASSLNSSRYSSLAAALATAADLNSVYVVNGDLYYNNSSGVAIQLTSGSGLNAASIGGIGGDYATSTAAVAYTDATKTFSFTQSSGVTADISAGSLILFEDLAGANGITLQSPTSLGSAYDLTLFTALPGSEKIVTLDASGNLKSAYDVDGATVEISANTIRVKDAGITRAKLAAVGQQISSSSGTFTTTSGSLTDITNLSAALTTVGRPVEVKLQPDGSGNAGTFSWNHSGSVDIVILRGATEIYRVALGSGAGGQFKFPASIVATLDVPAAGTYTYKAQIATSTGSVAASYMKLAVYEL